ncbi:type IV pilus secretin PilQ family protein [Sediminicurvatus halobius]|nr:type IV pilus secretin PilQ family protein [Spiribacter halobius]UEX78330.1 type IV pilus secretin PilQ [Spiribacter halobius]
MTRNHNGRRRMCRFHAAALALLLLLIAGSAGAATLQDVDYSALPGNAVQITFNLDEPVEAPRTFNTENPARIALDFVGVRNGLAERSVDIGEGVVEGLSTAEAGGRTRAVLRLSRLVPFDVKVQGNQVFVTVAATAGDSAPAASAQPVANGNGEAGAAADADDGGRRINGVDFRRGGDGSARIIVELSDETTPVDVNREGGRIVVDFLGASVPDRLQRRLDVTDFATPARFVETRQRNGDTRVAIDAEGEYDQIAYQADNTFTIELQPITEAEQERRAREEPEYTGERLSLNFQDIEVRSVLQLIADFTGLNIVVSDSVSGNITLRLQNVPWDQALDIILQTKGLDKRTNGNVMLVAPAEEIAARERQELESREQLRALTPLRSEFIEINYAKAADLAELIRGIGGDGGEDGGDEGLLSERGSISIDERTNTLIVRDTDRNLADIRRLVTRLDIPVRQVLIESRLVIASDDFSDELGVRFGYSRNGSIDGDSAVFGGTRPGAFNYGGTTGFEVPADEGTEGLLVDLPASNAAGSAGLAIGRVGSYLLQLELSAMESENRGEIISSPRVVTANQREAEIKQGVEIPFQEATSSGATSIEFREAVLGLVVTPQITPDDRVLLDLQVNQDSRGEDTPSGPAINTQSVRTQVLVDNGETVVLGGVFERTQTEGVERIPFFGELPLVGWMFRNRVSLDENSELLVFVTPRILDEQLGLNN